MNRNFLWVGYGTKRTVCQCVKALLAALVIVMMRWDVLWHSLQSPPSSLMSPQMVIPSVVHQLAYVCLQIVFIKFSMAWLDGDTEFVNPCIESSQIHFKSTVHNNIIDNNYETLAVYWPCRWDVQYIVNSIQYQYLTCTMDFDEWVS